MRRIAPLAFVVGLFGVTFGVLARDAGFGPVASIVFSATTFAGSSQFAAAGVISAGGTVAAATLAALLLNLRYLAIGMSVRRPGAPRTLVAAAAAHAARRRRGVGGLASRRRAL